MKYLVLLAVLGIAYALWRNQHRREQVRQHHKIKAPQDMVACAHCGVHLPRCDALVKTGQHFCSPAHRDLTP